MESSREYQIAYYVVCVIDILGQQDHLAQWSHLPTGENSADALVAIQKSAGTVVSLKKEFEAYFKSFDNTAFPEMLDSTATALRDLYRRARSYTLRTQQFGDTFVFYSPIETSARDQTTFPLHAMVQAGCFFILHCLARKVPLRGAICIGTGIELENGLFYGPAFAAAHHLESNIAEYPRIVVAPEVKKFLEQPTGYSSEPVIDKIVRDNAAICSGHITTDRDGCFMLDFMGDEFRGVTEWAGVIPWTQLISQAYEYAMAERERFRDKANNKLALRYDRLVTYMERHLPKWGVEDVKSSA